MSNPEPADLPGAGVPADHGLSSLGMLMQLGGSLFAAILAVLALSQLVESAVSPSHAAEALTLWILLAMTTCIGRSLLQRAAGAELLYGTRDAGGNQANPLRSTFRYIAAGLVHSALIGGLAIWKFDVPVKAGLGLALGLAAWPLALLGMMSTGRFKRYATAIPVTEDKGFEGAAVLMTIFGVCGVLATGSVLAYFLKAGADALEGVNALLLITVGVLFVRSCLHVHAGVTGLRTTSIDRAVELSNRYANFGVISSFCAAGGSLMFAMSLSFSFIGIIPIVCVCWMLMAWPLIVRRFFSDRQFADMLAGEGAAHRRAPDAGLTGLGWFLLAHSMIGMFGVASTVFGSTFATGKLAIFLPVEGHSPWWAVGVTCLEAWAGFELVRMSKLRRIVPTAFGVIGAGITLWITWPVLKDLTAYRFGPTNFIAPAMLGLGLVIPVVTLLLVNRQTGPTARARYRVRPEASGAAQAPVS